MGNQILNIQAFRDTKLTEQPFPFIVVKDFIKPDQIKSLVNDYPNIKGAGLYPMDILQYGNAIKQLVAELAGEELRQAVAEKFKLELNGRPPMITFRRYARYKDGRIHTDTKSKVLSMLLYLNESWPYQGGRLRLLRDPHDINSTIVEVPPLAGTIVMFKVTPNGWHGHDKFVGERRAIMLNYITDQQALEKELGKHRFSAKVKSFKHILGVGRMPANAIDCVDL